ncbi:hypothetical protein CFE70_003301 [Pyrenophora teres f. teres 0-1]|uniref:Uncharacterized protein n=1 Tax=Pyrenophora teres f. teres (strain 0-1) TaxID=861557 RepID=E3S0X5_PYRTT|nr:hypothetical protein PTT_15772 [Pyrenophora teres f. teres 0-1]KAE8846229.1 hypothetical protein HRS9139_00796 [Pyrenophora teres f. teres]KAE8853464.1 hypothetical protein HRS9122_00456 [Pyrenophora teres f. teres]KAE8873060.1 hypothetical protein PTNB73_02211 [Pyrenophora teres f. teres]
MLPPVDPAVLQRNPNFDVLYKDLCTRKLNPNGSTRDTKRQRVHDEIHRTLSTTRTTLLTSQILITTLSDLGSKAGAGADDITPDLHAAIDIVTAQLNNQIPPTDLEILSNDISTFSTNIVTIASAVSTQLGVILSYLCKIADPLSPPAITDLPTRCATLLQTSTQTLPQDLQDARFHLTNTFTALLALHSTLLTTSIKILEQTQHGTLARHTKSSADLLHAKATLLGLQAKIHTYSHPPPAEFVAALKEFKRVQGSGEKALRDREGLATRELELYARAGEKGMKDLARRKERLVGEVEMVESAIGKLERRG